MRVLLLGGTGEATGLARALAEDNRYQVTVSLAGITRAPRPLPLPTRLGGFGGAGGLADYLRAERIQALLDATHPFAARITANAAQAAGATGAPLLRLHRPAWMPGAGDDWTEHPDMPSLAAALGDTPRRVLLTIGQKELAAFRAAPWHHYVIRSVDPPDPALLPPRAEVLTATGPFALEEERALLRRHGIERIASKNSGGAATAAKLVAARELGVPVHLLARPPLPPGLPVVEDAADALAWLHARRAERGA
ncbi:cobalt-precorrin-6A reductase [Pseudoroseomonas cervicalis]|uniref:cobalt-precorrin-6A reductase n=1 Tax=Teichococcus cervicalis TaxID=204525 RepID=UPI00278B0918|nr:cobalt-precorrin-6A reductase [Pseudoroseomonas cervicalis]MDQ1080707.1 precorrin-6A/cobalt-precorrin-6A reductase [Pseudoroseomonas cervicalis]